MKTTILSACIVMAAGAAFAGGHGGSTFQNTCSEIRFAYQGNEATIQAVCLRADGSAVAASTPIMGISNQDGKLTMSGGASSFQQSCGNIGLEVLLEGVTLSANCRRANGQFLETAIDLNGINNNNGALNPNN